MSVEASLPALLKLIFLSGILFGWVLKGAVQQISLQLSRIDIDLSGFSVDVSDRFVEALIMVFLIIVISVIFAPAFLSVAKVLFKAVTAA